MNKTIFQQTIASQVQLCTFEDNYRVMILAYDTSEINSILDDMLPEKLISRRTRQVVCFANGSEIIISFPRTSSFTGITVNCIMAVDIIRIKKDTQVWDALWGSAGSTGTSVITVN